MQWWSHSHQRLNFSGVLPPWASLLSRLGIFRLLLLLLLFHYEPESMRGATSVSQRRLRGIILQILHLLSQVFDRHLGHKLLVLLHDNHLVKLPLARGRLLTVFASFIFIFFFIIFACQCHDIDALAVTSLLFMALRGGFDSHLMQWVFLWIW